MRTICRINAPRPAIDSNSCVAIAPDNIASASTINGGFALTGRLARRNRLESRTIITKLANGEQEERLPPVHPGEVLLEDFMKPLGLSQYRLAQDLGVPALRISQIVHGKRAVTADTALRLARYFGTSANVWMRLQARYDLEVAETALAERVKREVRVRQPLTPAMA